jgi:hypothetical protein
MAEQTTALTEISEALSQGVSVDHERKADLLTLMQITLIRTAAVVSISSEVRGPCIMPLINTSLTIKGVCTASCR